VAQLFLSVLQLFLVNCPILICAIGLPAQCPYHTIHKCQHACLSYILSPKRCVVQKNAKRKKCWGFIFILSPACCYRTLFKNPTTVNKTILLGYVAVSSICVVVMCTSLLSVNKTESREVHMTTPQIEDTATYPSKTVTKQQGRKQHCTRNIPWRWSSVWPKHVGWHNRRRHSNVLKSDCVSMCILKHSAWVGFLNNHCSTFSIQPFKSRISIMAKALLFSMIVVGQCFYFHLLKVRIYSHLRSVQWFFFFILKDSVQETDTEWEVILKVKVKQLKQSDKDIYRVQQVSDSLCCSLLSKEPDPLSGSLAFYFK